MEPSFDIRGNLKPYERIKLDAREFKSTNDFELKMMIAPQLFEDEKPEIRE